MASLMRRPFVTIDITFIKTEVRETGLLSQLWNRWNHFGLGSLGKAKLTGPILEPLELPWARLPGAIQSYWANSGTAGTTLG